MSNELTARVVHDVGRSISAIMIGCTLILFDAILMTSSKGIGLISSVILYLIAMIYIAGGLRISRQVVSYIAMESSEMHSVD